MKKQAWQTALADLITDPQELWQLLDLDKELLAGAIEATKQFPLKAPRNFVTRMQKGNAQDPLLLQVLPHGLELNQVPGYSNDPLAEIDVNPVPGLLHKYQGRVLVTLTSACAVHCRYCFRRHFPYTDNNPGSRGWEKIMAYIEADTSISEVILSGGDPLTVNDRVLHAFSAALANISHLKRLRIHSRLPVVLPERITDEFVGWLRALQLETVIVIHANHPNEINDAVRSAILKLRHADIMLLNQSVLLKSVNDNVAVLKELSESLFAIGVLPYYLHVLDKVDGAAHFDISRDRAKQLAEELRKQLPGYLVPRLVCEEAGAESKHDV